MPDEWVKKRSRNHNVQGQHLRPGRFLRQTAPQLGREIHRKRGQVDTDGRHEGQATLLERMHNQRWVYLCIRRLLRQHRTGDQWYYRSLWGRKEHLGCPDGANEGKLFFKKLTILQNPLWACSALAVSPTEIILIGGKNTNRNGEVHLFNVNSKTWKSLHSMNQLRVSHKSFFFQNRIYVIGGDYDMSCEVYDIRENKWSFISSYNSLLGNSLYSFSSAIAIAEWVRIICSLLFYITNVVNYRPDKNRKPTPKEINEFKRLLFKHIEIIKSVIPMVSTIQKEAFAIYNDIEVSRLESCIKVLLLK